MSTFVTNEFRAKPGRGGDAPALLLDLAPESAGRPGASTSQFAATKTNLTT
jgi:hypothetical protein